MHKAPFEPRKSPKNRIFSPSCGVALGALGWGLLAADPLQAETLIDALQAARDRSEQIASAEAEHDADEAGVVITKADGLPSVVTSVDFNENLIGTSNGSGRISVQGQATMPIYQGGAVRNGVLAAKARSDASQTATLTAEADLFTAVVGSYANVVRDAQIVKFSEDNLASLTRTLKATRARYRLHDLTKTDLAQAEARAAIARGELESASAKLVASSEEFTRLTGLPATALADLPPLEDLPATADEAANAAIAENPRVIAARRTFDSRSYDVEAARGQSLPTLAASFTGRHSDGRSLAFGQTASRFGATVGLSLRWSVFQGGRASARISQAAARQTQAQLAIRDLERTLAARARSDFSNWKAALAVLEASEQAVKSARQALSGVKAESDVGSRTILDILNAEQELRNTQVQVANARRDGYLAAFSLLTTMGRTHSRKLSFAQQTPEPVIGPVSPASQVSSASQALAPIPNEPAVAEPAPVASSEPAASPAPLSVLDLPPASAAPPPAPAPAPQAPADQAADQAANPAPGPAAAPAADQELPALEPDPVPTVAAAPDPVLAARPATAPSRPSPAARAFTAASKPTDWAIQLAAFRQKSAAKASWGGMAATVRAVAGRQALPLVSTITINGNVMHRLAISGFANFSEAETTCHDLRDQGLQCIVRRQATLGTIEPLDAAKN